jgi:hypothetical protein
LGQAVFGIMGGKATFGGGDDNFGVHPFKDLRD